MVLALKEFTSLAVNAYYVSIPISCINAQMYTEGVGWKWRNGKAESIIRRIDVCDIFIIALSENWCILKLAMMRIVKILRIIARDP